MRSNSSHMRMFTHLCPCFATECTTTIYYQTPEELQAVPPNTPSEAKKVLQDLYKLHETKLTLTFLNSLSIVPLDWQVL